MSQNYEKQFQEDVKSGVAKLLREDSRLSAADALSKVTKDMLANNPFVPPQGCPVNDLPNEILAHIFFVGMELELDEEGEDEEDEEDFEDDELDVLDWNSDDEGESESDQTRYNRKKGKDSKSLHDDDDDDGEQRLPFQVLVSHVCRHWREVAIESPLLWTMLSFELGTSLDMAKTWLERSKGHPLEIVIDCTPSDDWEDEEDDEKDVFIPDVSQEAPEISPSGDAPANDRRNQVAPPYLTKSQVSEIMDIIIPSVERFKVFSVTAQEYDAIYLILERLSQCSSAPLLEALEMYHYEDCEEFTTFSPPELNTRFLLFNGVAPKLKSVALWGVHVDFEASLPMLSDLRDLEIAYHAEDVRPSFKTLSDIFASSPELETLSLCLSGPAGTKDDWGTTLIELPSVKSLTLCHHEAAYIESLLPLLHLPNVVDLYLDYDSEDYSNFANLLAKPLPGRTKSLLAGLEHLRIDSLPSNRKARESMLEQLFNLKSIRLNCGGDEEEFFEKLMELKPTPSQVGTAQSVMYCPHLTVLLTTGINGSSMRRFVEARKQGGVPLTKVMMGDDVYLEEREEKWLRDHLEEFDIFEPSDSEEELEEIDADDIVEMDMD